jgi:FdrA protein
MGWSTRVLPNRYADSVRLMAVARDVRELDGVDGCEIGIGTPANLEVLSRLGADVDATPADVVIAVDARDGEVDSALEAAERAIATAEAPAGDGAAPAADPRSLVSVDADLALISVPGDYAALAAHQALTRDMDVMLFSDNVPVEAEIALKRRAVDRGRLMMGPDCGTAMIDGVGLGFMNVVRRGPVGIVAAAGTGAQEVACLLDAYGLGVSQIVGVGGRDLSAEVGGTMFRAGIERLAADDETETLLLVSKPPDAEVVAALGEVMPAEKRVVAAFVGRSTVDSRQPTVPFELHSTLEAGALAVAGASDFDVTDLERTIDERRVDGDVLGLYSGGTLCHEAAAILESELGAGGADRLIDLGADEYTRGRPHPMVDPGPRVEKLEEATGDDSVGCVLIDVVLGYAGHGDPAGALAPAVERVAARIPVVARVCGTRGDPQDADAQTATLRDAGALVAPSNAAAARLAARAVRGAT